MAPRGLNDQSPIRKINYWSVVIPGTSHFARLLPPFTSVIVALVLRGSSKIGPVESDSALLPGGVFVRVGLLLLAWRTLCWSLS